MAKERGNKIDWLLIAAVTGPVLGVVVAMMSTGFIADKKLADIPYVDSRFIEGKHYTDEKVSAAFERAVQHSDDNHTDMIHRMDQQIIKYETMNAIFSGKLDTVISSMKEMRDEFSDRRRRK